MVQKIKGYRGIILAGGEGTRLYPSTLATSKQLLPIYDKPMIYYPLTTMIQAGINEILIITNPSNVAAYQRVFEHAHELGLDITVTAQTEPGGIPEAFIIGEQFIGDSSVCLILGDNFFYGAIETPSLSAVSRVYQAHVYAYTVSDPSAYGVLRFDSQNLVDGIVEKPDTFVSNQAVTGLYFYPNDVVEIAKGLKPSKRGELEITDVNQHYCDQNRLVAHSLPKGAVWLDAGTHDALADATSFVRTMEARTGFKVGCYEEAAFENRFVDADGLMKAAERVGGVYGNYLRALARC